MSAEGAAPEKGPSGGSSSSYLLCRWQLAESRRRLHVAGCFHDLEDRIALEHGGNFGGGPPFARQIRLAACADSAQEIHRAVERLVMFENQRAVADADAPDG